MGVQGLGPSAHPSAYLAPQHSSPVQGSAGFREISGQLPTLPDLYIHDSVVLFCHANNLAANPSTPWRATSVPVGRSQHSRVEWSCAQHQLRLILLQVLKADTEPGRESMQSAGFLDIKAQFTFHCLSSQRREQTRVHKHRAQGCLRRCLSETQQLLPPRATPTHPQPCTEPRPVPPIPVTMKQI